MGRGAMSGLHRTPAPASPIATVELCARCPLRRPELRRQLDRFRERRFRLLLHRPAASSALAKESCASPPAADRAYCLQRRNRCRRVARRSRRVSQPVPRPAIRRFQLAGSSSSACCASRRLLFCEHFLPEQQESDKLPGGEPGRLRWSLAASAADHRGAGGGRFENETLGLGQLRRRREGRFRLLQFFWARNAAPHSACAVAKSGSSDYRLRSSSRPSATRASLEERHAFLIVRERVRRLAVTGILAGQPPAPWRRGRR